MRYFNTTGPCDPARHYMLSASARLPRARRLIGEGRYFVVHAPRQTGKTTTMTTLAREMTATGERATLLASIQTAGPLRDDIESVERAVLDSIRQAADRFLPQRFRPPAPWPETVTGNRIIQGLTDWAVACPLPPGDRHPHHLRPPPHGPRHRRSHSAQQGDDTKRARHHPAPRLIAGTAVARCRRASLPAAPQPRRTGWGAG
jgi:hypothetical protein